MRQSNRYPRNPERDAVAHPTGRPTPGVVGTDREAGSESPRGPPRVTATYWFQRNLSGLISPVEPVIHPPRASAKDWPLFVFQQLIPSWVEWQA